MLSRYARLDSVAEDIKNLTQYVKEVIEKLRRTSQHSLGSHTPHPHHPCRDEATFILKDDETNRAPHQSQQRI
jgi:hypothetical protein